MKSNGKPTLSGATRVDRRAAARRELARFKRTLREHLPELRARYGVKSLGVFGSYVRGEARKRSDLDVLVELGDDRLSLFKFIELENYLSDLLGIKVDLVERQTLKPAIGQRILAEVVQL
jgi:predicted nucleotidyltransferase